MAYNTTSRIIAMDQPVSVADVQAALGVNVNDLATLCAHEKINKWSRFKPIRDPRPGIKLEDKASNTSPFYNFQLAQTDMNAGVTGTVPNPQGACGLNIVAHQRTDLLNADKLAMDWEYLPPTGKAKLDGTKSTNTQEWTAQRLGDFRGYSVRAACPFHKLIPGNILPYGGEIKLRADIKLAVGGNYNGANGSTGVSVTPGALTTSELMFPNTSVPLSECKKVLILVAKDANKVANWDNYAAVTARDHRTADGIYDVFPFPNNHFTGSKWANGAVAFVGYVLNAVAPPPAAWNESTLVVLHPLTPRFDVTFGDTSEAREITVIIKGKEVMTMGLDDTTGSTGIQWTLDITVGDNGGLYPDKSFTFGGTNQLELIDKNGTTLWHSTSLIPANLSVTESYTDSGTLSTSTPGLTKDRIESATKIRVRLHNSTYTGESVIMRTVSPGIGSGAVITPFLP